MPQSPLQTSTGLFTACLQPRGSSVVVYDVAAVDALDVSGPAESHCDLQLLFEHVQEVLDASLALAGVRPDHRSAQEDKIGS